MSHLGILKTVSAIIVLLIVSACCDEKSIPKYTQLLYSHSAKDRNDAALALARCGSAASGAVYQLGSLLYDDNVGVQSAAAYALRKIDTTQAQKILKQAEDRRHSRD